ncbi:MAG: nuclear transport factor 2 family protein [Gammaproteobacteria bacterium]|nr:nuclear transport factor 2 family protein [Gammaproteobacteria bacterium]
MENTGYPTPLDAEQAFYAAFERADADAMRAVWAASEDIECVHPLGERLRGDDVHQGWRDMFAEAERLAFHLSDRRAFEHDGLTVHLLLENILFPDGKTEPLQILATNVYRHATDGWRMVMRHASPAPAGLASPPAARGAVH